MKRFTMITLLLVSALFYNAKAQDATVNEKLTEVNDKVTGLTERLATDEADLSKLTKIKVSGYIQAQYQSFDSPSAVPNNAFSIRRARVKFTYEATDGIKFVLQPDFAPAGLSVKDAYVVLNDRWTKSFSLTAGKFNRPNYEVEYSSSQREMVERSALIRALYPGERAIGAKLEFNPQNLPLHLQIALLNGGEGYTVKKIDGTVIYDGTKENTDYDKYKDIMVRATYNLSLGSFGGLDLGAHGYFGSIRANSTKLMSSDYKTITDIKVGDAMKKNWVGAEFQLFADILGGMSLKGEYIAGKNISAVGFNQIDAVAAVAAVAEVKDANGVVTTKGVPAVAEVKAVPGAVNVQNYFSGYYLYFIKNLGKKNQFAFRYDYYDPNTKISGKDISGKDVVAFNADKKLNWTPKSAGKGDLATSTFGFAFHHYFDDNLRITLAYDMVKYEKVSAAGVVKDSYTANDGKSGTLDYNNTLKNNTITLRIQAKF
jgi:hypothetical protein